MKEYDNKTLKRVQSAELEILRDFVAICEKYHLVYFGIAGTAIGAIRHKGFIPWDDDIDIAMPREDLEKFIQIAKKEYSNQYFVLNGNENENFPLMTTQWVMRGTRFVVEPFKRVHCPFGIYLDLFPLDKIPDDEKLFRKQARQAFFYSKLLILRSVPFPTLGFEGWKEKLVHAICGMVHLGMVILHISKKRLYQKCLEISTQYNYLEKTKRIDFVCDTTAYISIYKLKDIYPLKQMEFEGILLNFPNKIEDNLRKFYGDFMQLPPVKKRKNHYPYKLKFKETKKKRD